MKLTSNDLYTTVFILTPFVIVGLVVWYLKLYYGSV